MTDLAQSSLYRNVVYEKAGTESVHESDHSAQADLSLLSYLICSIVLL